MLVRIGERVVLLDARGQQLLGETLDPSDYGEPVLALGLGGQLVAIGERGPRIRVIDRRSGKRHAWSWVVPGDTDVEEPEDRGVMAIAFTPAGDGVVAVDRHGGIVRWDLPGGRQRRRISGRCRPGEVSEARDGDDPMDRHLCGIVDFAAISPDGELVATSGSNGDVRVREVRTGKALASWNGDDASGARLAFSPTRELVVLAEREQWLRWRPGARELTLSQEYAQWRPVPEFRVEEAGLTFTDSEPVQWDLETGERHPLQLAQAERLLEVVDGGRRVWSRGRDAVVLRDFRGGAEQLRVPVQRGVDGPHVGQAPPGHTLLAVEVRGGWDHHVVGPDGARVVRLDALATALTPNGRWLVESGLARPRRIWDVTTGKQVHTLAATGTQVEFAEVGPVIGWIDDKDHKVRSRRLDEPDAPDRVLNLGPYRLHDLAISTNGDEVLVASNKGLTRWSPGTGRLTVYPDGPAYLMGVDITGGGATLTLRYHDRRVEIYGNNEHMDLLATVLSLEGGHWVALSKGGAVDGSPDAPGSMLVRVAQDSDALVFDGRLAWDGAVVRGLVPRALLGEDVQAPGILRVAPRYQRLRRGEPGP